MRRHDDRHGIGTVEYRAPVYDKGEYLLCPFFTRCLPIILLSLHPQRQSDGGPVADIRQIENRTKSFFYHHQTHNNEEQGISMRPMPNEAQIRREPQVAHRPLLALAYKVLPRMEGVSQKSGRGGAEKIDW